MDGFVQVEDLSLETRYRFCMAPVNNRDPRALAALLNFAAKYAAKKPVVYSVPVPERAPRSADELKHMESSYQVRCLRCEGRTSVVVGKLAAMRPCATP